MQQKYYEKFTGFKKLPLCSCGHGEHYRRSALTDQKSTFNKMTVST